MTSFTWKRKAGEHVRKETVIRFGQNALEEEVDLSQGGEDVFRERPDSAKRPKIAALEDRLTKKRRLKEEGCVLSENERYWEALKKWDEAILLCPEDETLYEMKAQVLMELKEVYPAIQSAKHAVSLRPNWWVAHQTLGRAQLSTGEVQLAIRSFSEACHLRPDEEQLWEEDLGWARSLMAKSRELAQAADTSSTEQRTLTQSGAKLLAVCPSDDIDEYDFDNDVPEPVATSDAVHTLNELNPNTWVRFRPSDS